ncbi:unnamed protein product, partial [Aphanomyces euteiches]
MHSPLFPPAFRYANEAVAKLWLDTVVADYAKIAGVSICKGGAGQAVRRDVPMLMQSFAAAAPVENVPDVDITAVYGLKAFLAHKFKTFSEITDNMSVHELATGKSAVQNEVVGELEADAKTWINSVMDEYGSVFSVTIPYASKAGGAASAGVPMMGGGVSSAELDALKAQMSTMMREQVNAYQAFMKFDALATLKKTNPDEIARREKQIDLWMSEHGEYDEKGIQPKFDAKKIHMYGSYWKGVMQDALYYRTLANVEGVKIGARGSKLILFPFNQASSKHCGALVDHIYEQLNLDLVIPFDAISGPTLSDIDSKSELAHCIMLTNTYRMRQKHRHSSMFCNAIFVPPTHGTVGGDGLYTEAKLGLEALMNKWHSEGWKHYLTIDGAVIGWTRGTGLMAGNNMVSACIEKLGVCTFNQVEMAFHLTSILHPRMVAAAAKSPLWVDSGGGMARLHDLKVQTDNIRAAITEESKIRRASVEDRKKDSVTDVVDAEEPVWNRANMYYADTQVKSLYEENILKHSGIRVIEPELFEGYDPKKKIILQQVDKNMRPIE